MVSTGRKRQRILLFGAETDAATEAVFGQIRVSDILTIVCGNCRIFEYKYISLTRFRIRKFAVYRVGIKAAVLAGLILKVNVETQTLTIHKIFTLVDFQQCEHVVAVKVHVVINGFDIV